MFANPARVIHVLSWGPEAGVKRPKPQYFRSTEVGRGLTWKPRICLWVPPGCQEGTRQWIGGKEQEHQGWVALRCCGVSSKLMQCKFWALLLRAIHSKICGVQFCGVRGIPSRLRQWKPGGQLPHHANMFDQTCLVLRGHDRCRLIPILMHENRIFVAANLSSFLAKWASLSEVSMAKPNQTPHA